MSFVLGKRKAILFVLLVLSLLVVFVLRLGESVFYFYGGGAIFNNSISMKVHEVTVGEASFCVPEAYFVYANSLDPDSSIGIILSVNLEDLEPWSLYDERVGFSKSRNSLSRDEVNQIEAKKLGLKIAYSKEGSRSIDNRWKILLGVTGVQEENSGKYIRLMPLKASMFKYYLVPQGAVDYSYIIGCNSGARCSLENYYGNGVRYEISFDETKLDAVGDIEMRSRRLIDKFICE
ncbi:hypothetical protein [Pseudomonas xionganensis]|uniref:Uncharacterized protein n=1 Tax=Pseudomonas xionganensis TaxID=2654845 RepID=A0A6I4KR92_9PSED|nr:hypothetical protein [Pseudomonas xionganensis]MVW74161.1 hypothetical protein [Pseudomonas xionganensis]